MAKRDWSHLPPELLLHISKQLADISDFVRFRAVCTRWRSSAGVSDPCPQLPWLTECCAFSEHEKYIRFYSCYSGKVHVSSVPEARGKELSGPSHGYLLAYDADHSTISLLNPLTRSEIPLPKPLKNIEFCVPLIGSQQTRTGDLLVIQTAFGFCSTFGFCRLGDKKWSMLKKGDYKCDGFMYYNGMYFIDKGRSIHVIDATTSAVVSKIPHPKSTISVRHLGETFLCESEGELLRVFCLGESENRHYAIHRLDIRISGMSRWGELTSIGDRILFMDQVQCFTLNARNFPWLKGNCIFHTECIIKEDDNSTSVSNFVCKYDIESDTTVVMPCPLTGDCTWFVPSLN